MFFFFCFEFGSVENFPSLTLPSEMYFLVSNADVPKIPGGRQGQPRMSRSAAEFIVWAERTLGLPRPVLPPVLCQR